VFTHYVIAKEIGQYKPLTGHTLSKKGEVGVNVLTVDQFLQRRNNLLIV